jgi:hypothetical protein
MRLTALCRRIASRSLLIAAAKKAAHGHRFRAFQPSEFNRSSAAYISDTTFARCARLEGCLTYRSKVRSGLGYYCRQRAERVRSAASPRRACQAVPFPLAMTVTIELDMPLDVVDEMAQTSLVVLNARERFLQPAEHLGDDVLAAKKMPRRRDHALQPLPTASPLS